MVAEQEADTQQDSTDEGSQNEAEQASSDSSGTSSQEAAGGTVTVKESVKVRKSASTDAESLGTAYEGDKLELLMKQADGWTRIKYKGQTAYVKSDYVE